MSGQYRMSAGGGRNRSFSLNDSNADLQDRDYHHLFGERLNNTFDPAIYSLYHLDIDADLIDRVSMHAQVTADPWSYVGTTGDIRVPERQGVDSVTVNLKYWGPNNSTIDEIYRADLRNVVSVTGKEAHNYGEIVPGQIVRGISDQLDIHDK